MELQVYIFFLVDRLWCLLWFWRQGVQAICIAILPRRCRPSFRARFGCRPRSLFLAEHTPIFWDLLSPELELFFSACSKCPLRFSTCDKASLCTLTIATSRTWLRDEITMYRYSGDPANMYNDDTIILVPYLMQFLRAWSDEAHNSQPSVKAHRSTMDSGLFRLVNS